MQVGQAARQLMRGRWHPALQALLAAALAWGLAGGWISQNWLTILSTVNNARRWGVLYQEGLEANTLEGWLYYPKLLPAMAGAWLVAAVLAGWVLLLTRPQTLADAHILRVVPPGGGPAPHPSGPGTTTTSRPAQTTPVAPAGGDASSASFTVATPHFDVVVATSGPCWVQITSSSVPQPLASGVQPAGKVLTVPAQGTMTVQVGSAGVLVGITIRGRNVFSEAPKAAPFTYTFTPPGA